MIELTRLSPSSRRWRVLRFLTSCDLARTSSLRDGSLALRLELRLLGVLATWAVPVVDHLCRQDQVEREASQEAVQNELVVHLL